MYQYRLYPEISTVIIRYLNTYLEEILDSLYALQKDPRYSPNFKGIVDMRKANTEINPEEISKISTYVNSSNFSTNKWALLVSTPKETVHSLIYAEQVKAHEIQVFSTIEGVSSYLKVEVQELLDF